MGHLIMTFSNDVLISTRQEINRLGPVVASYITKAPIIIIKRDFF